ncbi:MAG: tetratricopeptide repeat protein [Candidatus Eisenbacteria bacterium]
MIVPRRAPTIVRHSVGVPWVARERRPSPLAARVAPRLLWTMVLTLAFNALAFAEEIPNPPIAGATHAPSDVMPLVHSPAAVPSPVPPKRVNMRKATVPTQAREAPQPPADLRDVQAWMSYKQARHLSALSTEARLFYRQGLTAKLAGQDEEAMRAVRGAAELDPAFVAPHLTIASWLLTRDPSQALLQYANVLELLRQDFNLQLDLAANLLVLAIQALFAGLMLAGCLIVWLRREELLHTWQEQLGRFTSPTTAKWWALAFLVLPFIAGFGLALPTLLFLGLLWPALRLRERALFVVLTLAVCTLPLSLRAVERMALPLDTSGPPFYGIPTLPSESHFEESESRLRRAAAAHPNDPFIQFGLAWAARRGQDLVTAEQAYREALRLWPDNGRVLNNLGNVLAVQGRTEEALSAYKKAAAVEPTNAAAWFNASQIYTQRYEYQLATEALRRASETQFEMVKSYQSQATDDGMLPLVDQWLEPRAFWQALAVAPLGSDLRGSLPLTLRSQFEASGWAFSIIAALLAITAVLAGVGQAKRLPLRGCSNCGRVVCRRCAQRRREHALCPACAQVEAQAKTPDFSRVLLLQQRSKYQRTVHLLRTAFASILPGYGLLAHRRVFTAVTLLSWTWILGRLWFGYAPPFASEPRLTVPGEEVPAVLIVAVFALVQAVSLLGYFHEVAREREREAALLASQRTRVTQSTRRVSALAA